jgi:F-type H+-transporting ATPase subunit alpha
VGGKAQLPAYRSVTGNLKLAYSQFEELENYARFGTRLDEHTHTTIEHGKRIRNWLKQNEQQPLSVPEQVVELLALTNGLFDTVPVEKMKDAETALLKGCTTMPDELSKNLFADKPLSDEDKEAMLKIARDTLLPFQDEPVSDILNTQWIH